MTSTTLIGRRYDTAEAVTLEVRGARIASIEPLDDRHQGGELAWIAPGFVDLQVNGYGGQEFSSADLTVEKVAKIVRRMAEFGVTRFCPTVTTAGFDVLAHAMKTIAAACDADADVARSVLAIHLEGPFISPIDGPRGAHPLVHCRPPDWDEFARLNDAAGGRIGLVTLSPEYENAPKFIARAASEKIVVSIGHTAATSDQIRAAVDAGASMSTHLGNGAHRELPRHPNYLWDQLAEDRLTASLIVDGHHLPAEVVKTFWRAKTAERVVFVSDLSGLAGLPPGRYASELCDLEILDDGRLVIAGQRQLLAGASRPIGDGVANLMAFAGADLRAAVDAASIRPARLLDRTPATTGLEVGAVADLVCFQLRSSPAQTQRVARLEVRATYCSSAKVFEQTALG